MGYIGKPSPGCFVDWTHPLSRGLDGYWLFNEGSGSGLLDLVSGIVAPFYVGAAAPTWCASENGLALSFSATDAAVNVGNNPRFNYTTSDFSVLVDFAPGTSEVAWATFLCRGQWTVSGWYFQIYSTTLGLAFATNQSGVAQITYTGICLTRNRFQQCVATKTGPPTGASVRIYVNGKDKVSTAPNHQNPATTTNNLYLGRDQRSGMDTSGRLARVMLWRRCLRPTEVEWLSADPYTNILSPSYRRYFILVGAAVAVIIKRRMLMGLGQ